jgi:hypothetical protein
VINIGIEALVWSGAAGLLCKEEAAVLNKSIQARSLIKKRKEY